MLLAASLYVVAPTIKSRIEGKWLIHPKTAVFLQPAPVQPAAPVSKPSASSPVPDPETEPTTEIQETHPVAPRVVSKTISFMPGQAINIPNKNFRKIEIHSGYPLRIFVGPCHNDYTVEFICNSDPSDVFIVDTRHPPIFRTPIANSITITGTEF